MNQNNLSIRRFVNIKTIYILATLHSIILIVYCGRQWYSDTLSYIAAWDVISNYQIDMWRTPVYPIFLGILKTLFGIENYLFIGTIIQHFIFLISIYYFYQLSISIIKSYDISISITAFYAIYPCVATWNCFMITEPFTIYGTIFMLYCALKAYQENSTFYITSYAFWTIFIIFLRPAQIYILPVFLVGWILILFKEKRLTKVIASGISIICLSTLLLLLYCQSYNNNYGLFLPSGIGVINKYYIARLDGDIKPEHTNNEGLKNYIKETIDTHGQSYSGGTDHDLYMETEKAIYTYGLKEVSDLVSQTAQSDTKTFLRRFLQRIHKAANDKLFETYIHKWRNVTDIIGVNIKVVYWLLISFPFIIIYLARKTKQTQIIPIILYLLGASHIFIITYSCQNVWDRLIIPAVPVYLVMFGFLFNAMKLYLNRNIL